METLLTELCLPRFPVSNNYLIWPYRYPRRYHNESNRCQSESQTVPYELVQFDEVVGAAGKSTIVVIGKGP